MTDRLAAVVLAAGEGRRLRPLTHLRPKALCPVGNVPLLDQAVARARSVTSAVAVNAHHRHRQIADHLAASGAGAWVHLSVEGPGALGTAGALGLLRDWIDGRPVLVVNADGWHRADLRVLAAGWDGGRTRLLTVRDAARGTWNDRRYVGAGLLPWSEVRRFPATPSGLWEVSWRHLEPGVDLELVAYDGPFYDCGTPADYLAANMEASGGRTVVGEGALVEGRAEESVLWPHTKVGREEQLWRAVRASDEVTVLVR